jgi:hypothetical protein
MSPAETPLYVSQPSGKNLWQKYCVYPDRIELKSWLLLRTFSIPAQDIIDVEVRHRGAIADLWRGRSLASCLALKIDWADFFTHVVLRKRTGLARHVRFTPDEPEEFVEACRRIMKEELEISG